MISAAFLQKNVMMETIWDEIFEVPNIDGMAQEEIKKMVEERKAFQVTDQAFLDAHGDKVWLVMEGDWGGQVYLSVPIKYIGPAVTDAQIVELARKLDKRAWDCNEGDGCDISLVHSNEAESGIVGGMGGGLKIDGLWLHGEFGSPDSVEAISQALQLVEGTKVQIDLEC